MLCFRVDFPRSLTVVIRMNGSAQISKSKVLMFFLDAP